MCQSTILFDSLKFDQRVIAEEVRIEIQQIDLYSKNIGQFVFQLT